MLIILILLLLYSALFGEMTFLLAMSKKKVGMFCGIKSLRMPITKNIAVKIIKIG
jgi:hypothetical protein